MTRTFPLILLTLLLTGCQTQTVSTRTQLHMPGRGETANPAPPARTRPPSETGSPDANTDPCATALHDLAGPILLYYQLNQKLPPTLEAIKQSPAFEESMTLVCPLSKQPYTYDPEGIPAGGNKGKIILYDSAPSHNNRRWALSIIEPTDDRALITKVISLPESTFTKRGGR